MKIPKSIDEAVKELNGIGALITAKAWERAAIVYAFTALADSKGKTPNARSSISLSPEQFAALGIHGLQSKDTVRLYHERWAEHGKAGIKPGDTVTLPDLDWPPQDRNLGSRMPKTVEAAVAKVIETHGVDAVAGVIAQDDDQVRKVNSAAARRHGEREVRETTPKAPDLDRIYQDAAGDIIYREADRAAGRWTPKERTEAVRHFLIRALTVPDAISAEQLIDEITSYLQEVAS